MINQNKALFEYIIIDGLSIDDTLKIVKRYSGYIKLISEKDNGVYDAMNKGINIASGKYLYFLGAGDQLKEGVLEKINLILPQGKLNFVYGNVYRLDRNTIYDGLFSKSKLNKRNICHQAIFYERNIFNVAGKYDLKYKIKADYALNLKCYGCKEIKKKYINEVIADYKGFGISYEHQDENFMKERPRLIKANLGLKEYFVLKLRNCYVRIFNKLKHN